MSGSPVQREQSEARNAGYREGEFVPVGEYDAGQCPCREGRKTIDTRNPSGKGRLRPGYGAVHGQRIVIRGKYPHTLPHRKTAKRQKGQESGKKQNVFRLVHETAGRWTEPEKTASLLEKNTTLSENSALGLLQMNGKNCAKTGSLSTVNPGPAVFATSIVHIAEALRPVKKKSPVPYPGMRTNGKPQERLFPDKSRLSPQGQRVLMPFPCHTLRFVPVGVAARQSRYGKGRTVQLTGQPDRQSGSNWQITPEPRHPMVTETNI